MRIRLLTQRDEPALEHFLVQHRDSSMFLRSNARRAGLDYHGQRFEAEYVAAFRDDAIVAVAAHGWNGMLLVQAPEQVTAVVRACVAHSGRRVTGFSGPDAHVQRARAALALSAAETRIDFEEGLYALELSQLAVPAALCGTSVCARAARAEERARLVAWRVAYQIEVLNDPASAESERQAESFIDEQFADGSAWLAEVAGVPVAFSGFNARLPDIVQLGGIYTPPELRGRGYAKCAVAGALLAAREIGITRAVLFTQNPSALRCYQALGFAGLGSYGLVLLR
jgi:predicted GNAT family acetyltransferase